MTELEKQLQAEQNGDNHTVTIMPVVREDPVRKNLQDPQAAVKQPQGLQKTQAATAQQSQNQQVQSQQTQSWQNATQSQTAASDTPAYGYQPSAAVQQAQALLQQQKDSKPGAYQSRWSDEVNSMLDQILNREKFQYDFNEDALYQQYRDQYVDSGRMAMLDTIGNAAALTGGYGNSYAQGAGQQAYQQYMKGLNDILPELEQNAYARYSQEGQDMMDRYGLMRDQEDTEYGRYMDQMNQYYQDLQMAQDWYNTERSYDYGMYRDSVTDQQQDWSNAWALFQRGQDTPEIRAILGLPQKKKSSGGGGDDGTEASGSRRIGTTDLISEARRISQQEGAGAAYQYIQDQTGGEITEESAKAKLEALKYNKDKN